MKRWSLRFEHSVFAAGMVAVGGGASANPVDDGRDLAQRLCASCHAIERAERSPMPVAPAFRRIEARIPELDKLIERLQGGVLAGHPEMPAFVLKDHEARALVAYMRSLRD